MSDTTTLLEAVRASLARAARHNPGDVVPPSAILWTDADGQWQPVVGQLRAIVPELLTLGEFDSEARSGPAIWLRAVIEPKVRAERFPDLEWASDTVPVIYAPGVSRQTLRAVEECPDALRPLVELQYRGAVWCQRNGKDWSIRAFLVSEDGGLGLEVAEDRATTQSMLGALSKLAMTPVGSMQGRVLESEDFDKLMIDDTPRDLLLWMSDPDGIREEWDQEKWGAFRNRCTSDYDFDPDEDGELVAAEHLGKREASWQGVWSRFCESPTLYPGIPDLLRRAKPLELSFERDVWPDEADSAERSLRDNLQAVETLSPGDARQEIARLEAEHGARRGWVWAKLKMCRLAEAMTHLNELARHTTSTIGGDSAEAIAETYASGGYLADDAALRALASVKSTEDLAAVETAVRTIYLPWLQDTSEHFQDQLPDAPLLRPGEDVVEGDEGECILFVDGLRYDVGQRVASAAGGRQMTCASGWRWSALPTVTATAKPAVSPASGAIEGRELGGDFCPQLGDSGDKVTVDRLRKQIEAAGYQVLSANETGEPERNGARAWAEYGQFDTLGHQRQSKLAAQIDDQVELILDRVQELNDAGWKRVKVVTDHGWLLVPKGLPKVDLPRYLTESRWARCASIKESAQIDVPVAGWSWNPSRRVAYGRGVSCFMHGYEYAHGGVSLQECVIPTLAMSGSTSAELATVAIREVRWVGLRCRVVVEPAVEGFRVDVRTKPNDAASSVASEPKGFDSSGEAAILVPDDSLEGTVVSVVVLGEANHVVSKATTTVGGEE